MDDKVKLQYEAALWMRKCHLSCKEEVNWGYGVRFRRWKENQGLKLCKFGWGTIRNSFPQSIDGKEKT